jgi:hypothetical protein
LIQYVRSASELPWPLSAAFGLASAVRVEFVIVGAASRFTALAKG